MRILLLSSATLSVALAGCVPGGGGKDSGGGGGGGGGISDTGIDDTDETGMDDASDSAEVDRGTGDINGTVRVQLYSEDAEGEVIEVSWEEFGAAYPFGAIFVAAYTQDETTGESTYHAEQVIGAPNTAGDAYSLAVDLDDAASVQVYAVLDWRADGVIGTAEPIGIYVDAVPVVEGSAVDGVDIVINAPLLPGGGGDGGGDGGGASVTISGDLAITEAYEGGSAKVMLYDSAGQGPSYVTSVTPTATDDGAEGSYSLGVGADYGAGRLIAAWDDDQNGLIDPTDTWGAYVVDGENGNPITVGAMNLTGYNVTIPFGIPPALSPFVRLEGTVSYVDDFGTLPAGAVVYVAALRTRPSEDFDFADLENGYDWASFTGTELTGFGLDYLLVAPSSAVTYLWAFVDLDNDGVLNEAGEPIASYGGTGRVSTGTSNQSELDLSLVTVLE